MSFTDSETIETTLPLRGVWIHDPLDPEATIVEFPYGSAARDTAIDAMGEGTFFAGRTSPVFDYGEHEDRTVSCAIDVPHGETYQATLVTLEAFAASKRPMWFRDNRGRVVHGVMSGFKHVDQEWGSVASFIIVKVHRDVETVVI